MRSGCILEPVSHEGVSKLSGAMSHFEQTANIKLMCKLGKSASETLQTLQTVYEDNALKKQLCMTGTKKWARNA
jgi:hypothetical protein